MTGPITTIVPQMDDAIDVVVTGHTHQAYNCEIDGRLVTSASSAGRLVTDIDLRLDRRSGDVLDAVANNVPVSRNVAKDPAQSELIARYRELLGPIAGEVVGNAAAAIRHTPARETLFTGALGESPLGNLIADAQLAATRDLGSVVAFMNPGGVRADLEAGEITYEEAFTVQPFGNYLSTIVLTDAQLQCVLEQQFALGTVLQPAGITYTVNANGTSASRANPCTGTRVADETVAIGGVPIATDGVPSYRITVNNFLADGGDGFTTFAQGTGRDDVESPEDDLAAFIEYLTATAPTPAPATDRITVRP